MEELKEKLSFDVEDYVYADDMLFIVKEELAVTLIKELKRVSEDYRLILNAKKSGVLRVKNAYKEGDIAGIPVVK